MLSVVSTRSDQCDQVIWCRELSVGNGDQSWISYSGSSGIRIISDRINGRDTVVRACHEFSETDAPSLGITTIWHELVNGCRN